VKPDTFGDWLRQRRKERSISLRCMARLVGVSFSYLSKVETGDTPPPGAETLALLGAQLGVSPSRMYLEAGVVPPYVKEAFRHGVSIEVYGQVLRLLETTTAPANTTESAGEGSER
jgi:HTH-type transcriptional regulator, competence development regulator